jgi:hypothetical protein
VIVQPTGTGADGGRDILVTLTVHDSYTFLPKWVIQCKFHDTDIGKGILSDINIPTFYMYEQRILADMQAPGNSTGISDLKIL